MRARVDAALTLDARKVPPKVLERLCRALSFPNPAFLDRLRLGLNPGAELETVCFVEQRDRELRLPRGAIHVLRRAAAQEGLIVACDDARVLPEATLDVPALGLRDYQSNAVDKLAKVTQGTVVIPCGGGKTRVGMGAIAKLRTPTLVLVHTLDLAEQWLGELRDKLGVEAGLIGDGEERPASVTVAVIQALVRWEPSQLDAFLAGFGLLILDEAHHVAASTFRSVVDRCPARFRLGLTATPEREDGLTALLDLFLGPPLVTVTHEELVAAGVLTVPEIRSVETDFQYLYTGPDDYAPMLAAVASDRARNALIIEHVVEEARAGHVCLVLSGRIDHCHALCDGVAANGISAAVLTGEVKRAVRKEVLERARAGELSVIVATSLADEGLDLPRLSRVFLAYPGRARGRTVQRLGRLMRPHAEKTDAALFDFVDRKVPLLRRHHLERRKLYAEVLGIPASKLGARKGAA
ncbi:MAG: DEAD/DEAH box helicase [Polyangiaceae bacterium]|nr:DEAD/DEAH box helicase [Polyangiaceae bacterium]